jgi:pimeloyl-ACP methyl ester carboxylesterase
VTNTRAAFGAGRSQPSVDYTSIDLRDVPFHPINARRFPADLKARMVEKADAIPGHVLNHTIAHRDRWEVVDHLHELTMPLLLVNGRHERVFQPFIDEMRHSVSEFEIVHLDGGHSINVEQPHAFNLAVLDFVARHPMQPTSG